MYTKFRLKNGYIHVVNTQQYQVGTYFIFDNNPNNQGSTNDDEQLFHKNIREKVLSDGGIILEGNILDKYKDSNVNNFAIQDVEFEEVENTNDNNQQSPSTGE